MRSTLFVTPRPGKPHKRSRRASYFSRTGNILHGAGVVLLIMVFGFAYLAFNAVSTGVRFVRTLGARLFH